MRKFLFILILSACVCSCYKDLSTSASVFYPDIELLSSSDPINTSYGETLIFCPEIAQEGYTAEDFEYLWEIDFRASSASERLQLGTDLELNYKVANLVDNKPYYLTLTVKNKILGISKVFAWKVYISSALGEGIIVAHTKDNGQTSDIDFFAAKPISYGYVGATPTYKRGLYSFSNGSPIEGTVNQMTTMISTNAKVWNTKEIILALDSDIVALNNETFKVTRHGSEMFLNSTETVFSTSAVSNYTIYSSGTIVNGRVYGNVMNSNYCYIKVTCSTTPDNYFTKENTSFPKQVNTGICAFNPNDGKFYYMLGWTISGFTPIGDAVSFDAVGANCLGAGAVNQTDNAFIIVDKLGVGHFCQVSPSSNTIKDYTLTGIPLEDVISVAFCDNSMIAYLATENKIYVVAISGGVPMISALSWKPKKASEIITSIAQYQQAWYGTQQLNNGDYEFLLPDHRSQVIITTYDTSANEGKVYLCPFNVNTGKFSLVKDNGVYTGFGRITAVATTLK